MPESPHEPKTPEERLAICRACEQLAKVPVINKEICKACGCVVTLKVLLPQVHCPLQKW